MTRAATPRPTPVRTGEPRPRGAAVVREVFAVTLRRLGDVGFARLSVPEVAELAGVNKTSVYRRWPTKSDLVREALRASMAHAGPTPDTGSVQADLVVLARRAAAFVESPRGMSVMRMLFAEGANPDVRELAGAMLRETATDAPRAVIARATARGELAPDVDAALVLSTIAGALMHRVFVEQARLSNTYLDRLIGLLLHGAMVAGARTPTPPQRRGGARREPR